MNSEEYNIEILSKNIIRVGDWAGVRYLSSPRIKYIHTSRHHHGRVYLLFADSPSRFLKEAGYCHSCQASMSIYVYNLINDMFKAIEIENVLR